MGVTVVILMAAGGIYWKANQKAVYRIYASPDQKFTLVLYGYDRIFMAMPGSGSDLRGLLCLIDATTGKELARCRVDTVKMVEKIEWSGTNVYIPLVCDWALPNI